MGDVDKRQAKKSLAPGLAALLFGVAARMSAAKGSTNKIFYGSPFAPLPYAQKTLLRCYIYNRPCLPASAGLFYHMFILLSIHNLKFFLIFYFMV
jgi:hypothetical protein